MQLINIQLSLSLYLAACRSRALSWRAHCLAFYDTIQTIGGAKAFVARRRRFIKFGGRNRCERSRLRLLMIVCGWLAG